MCKFTLLCFSVVTVVSVGFLLFVRHLGGILAVANIRGGGEYGLTWYKGKLMHDKHIRTHDYNIYRES